MGSISVSNDFSTFCTNLRLQESTVTNIKNGIMQLQKGLTKIFGEVIPTKNTVYM